MPTHTSTRSVPAWLVNPSSWLSLLATAISVATFNFVYLDHGRLEVLLPKNLGLGLSGSTGYINLLISSTFSNSGAPRTRKHVLDITANVTPLDASRPFAGEYEWTFEKRFIGNDEYLKKYNKKREKKYDDYLDYVSRAIPFTLKGGDSTAKTIELEKQQKDVTTPPSRLKVELVVHTDTGNYRAVANYICPNYPLKVGDAMYCRRED